MASDILNSIIDWGDSVEVIETAPKNFKPGLYGSVCGIRIIEDEATSIKFNQKIGVELFLVEFDDGSSLEIPKIFLKKI